MKKLFLSISLVLISILVASGFVFAESLRFWTVNLSEPQAIQNSRSFNLDYIVASNLADTFTVDLYQNSVKIQTANLSAPDSGNFAVTVPSDGTYSYYISAENIDASETKVSSTVTTKVVTTIPDSVIYSGKTISGNAVAVNFTVPAGSSIVTVKIYGSTATSFTLDNSTLQLTLAATPGVAQVGNFVSASAANLNIAIVGFDAAGNQSAPVGDSTIRFNGNTASVGQGSNAPEVTATAVTETSSSTDNQSLTGVEGAATEGKGLAGWKISLIVIAAVIVAGAAGWYAYYRFALNKEDK